MKIKLKDLNSEIESWLEHTYGVSIDKDLYINHILKYAKIYVESANDPNTIYYQSSYAYQLYKLGEFEEAEQSIDKAVDEYIKEINKGNLPEHMLSLFHIDSYDFSPPYWKKGSKQESALRADLYMMVKDFFYHSEAYRILGNKYPEILNDVNEYYETQGNFKPVKIEVPKDIAITHFSVFKCQNERNENKVWLTEEAFNKFIENIYNDKPIEKQTFNLGKNEKQFIIGRFYQFYKIGRSDYHTERDATKKYRKLLTDNFDNPEFEDKSVSANFRASSKFSRSWSKYEEAINVS
jgi:hypothetical protein